MGGSLCLRSTSIIFGVSSIAIALWGCGGKAIGNAHAADASPADMLGDSSISAGGSSGSGSGGSSSGSSDDASSSGSSGVSDAMSGTCGTTGNACCPGEQCENTGLSCVGGVCSACGTAGEPCCGTSCNAGASCIAVGATSLCAACGQPGQVCCTTMPACANGDTCTVRGSLSYCINISSGTTGQPGDRCASTCVSPSNACYGPPQDGPASTCVVCGGLANPCCGTTCGTGLSCTAGTCQ